MSSFKIIFSKSLSPKIVNPIGDDIIENSDDDLKPPGKYRVQVKAVKLEGRPKKEIDVTVEVGKTVKKMIDF